ncbi:hypothetical protein [Tenacibaculum halocynthiae]|uniref:hypothetical protein n=1 Tax=Tenacibaculum halocynthiae TaxID=1254437 RepID=UPI003D658CE5
MKFLKLFCLVLMLCVSCSESETIDTIEKMERGRRGGGTIDPIEISDDAVDEKNKLMYMTSFLIGKTLIENENARDYFYELIKDSRLTSINLIDIMDSNVVDSNPFEVAFHEQFNAYNWHLNPMSGGPNPPVESSTAEPDPSKWGGILDAQMYYHQYLIEIIELNKWELNFPNKNIYIDNIQNLSDYLIANEKLICLWNMYNTGLYTDGLILNTNGRGSYLPPNFNVSTASSLVMILK